MSSPNREFIFLLPLSPTPTYLTLNYYPISFLPSLITSLSYPCARQQLSCAPASLRSCAPALLRSCAPALLRFCASQVSKRRVVSELQSRPQWIMKGELKSTRVIKIDCKQRSQFSTCETRHKNGMQWAMHQGMLISFSSDWYSHLLRVFVLFHLCS